MWIFPIEHVIISSWQSTRRFRKCRPKNLFCLPSFFRCRPWKRVTWCVVIKDLDSEKRGRRHRAFFVTLALLQVHPLIESGCGEGIRDDSVNFICFSPLRSTESINIGRWLIFCATLCMIARLILSFLMAWMNKSWHLWKKHRKSCSKMLLLGIYQLEVVSFERFFHMGGKEMCSALKFLPHSLCVQMWKLFRHPEMENVLRIYFLSTLELNRTIDARLNPRNRFDIAQRQARLELNQYTEK